MTIIVIMIICRVSIDHWRSIAHVMKHHSNTTTLHDKAHTATVTMTMRRTTTITMTTMPWTSMLMLLMMMTLAH